MVTSTWSNCSTDKLTALDIITPSTTTESISVSRLFKRLSTSTTRKVDWRRIFVVIPSQVNSDSSSALPQIPINNTATISDTIPSSTLRLQARVSKLRDFLARAVKSHEIREETARSTWKSWQAISNVTSSSFQVPDAGIGPDGEVLLVWKKEEHHFEMEISSQGSVELFYINHQSNAMWEYDYDLSKPLPKEITLQLTPFV